LRTARSPVARSSTNRGSTDISRDTPRLLEPTRSPGTPLPRAWATTREPLLHEATRLHRGAVPQLVIPWTLERSTPAV
jgi:hypothetical protein